MRALALFTLLPAAALATVLSVDVGEDGFTFNPDTLTAAAGDKVVFHFYPGAHSVAQSTFDSPCQPAPGGIWSGTFNPSSGEDSNVFEVAITNTDPIWIYCAQIGHCNGGMAMVINPPSSGNTLSAYKNAAKNANQIAPSVVEGGTVIAATAVSSKTESASKSASESASPTASEASSSAPPTTSAPSASASASASAAGTATASSSAATFTGSSNRNTVNTFLAVAFAGVFGLAILH